MARKPTSWKRVPWLVCAAFVALAAGLAGTAASTRRATAEPLQIAIIANPSVEQAVIDKLTLRHVFTGRTKVWPNGIPIARLQSPPNDPVRVEFDRAVLGMSASEVAKFWIDALVRGQTPAPRVLPNPAVMGQVVSALQGSIGYVPQKLVPQGVVVVAIVTDGQVNEP